VRLAVAAALPAAAAMLSGCSMRLLGTLASAWMVTTPQDVKAEYDLAPAAKKGRALVIRVWVDPYVENQHERAAIDVARAVAAAFKAAEDDNGNPNPLRGLDLVRPEAVKRYLDSRRGGDDVAAKELSDFFNAPLVLEVQVTEYTARAAGSSELYQGRIAAQLALFDFSEYDDEENRLPLKSRPVQYEFPEVPEQVRRQASELLIWTAVRSGFAKKVADKFRDHQKYYDPKEDYRSAE
jgi:hypothetical protein